MNIRQGLVSLSLLLAASLPVHAATFDVVFTNSSYSVGATDTFADILAQHNAASVISTNSVTAMTGIDTSIYAGGISGDYSVLMSTTLDIAVAGNYEFQIGTDWGRGGGVALFDTATNTILNEAMYDTDIWWANNWSHPDVISSTYNLSAGEYTIMWLGFEGCCAGSSTVRFAYEGGAFATLSSLSIGPYLAPAAAAVPVPPAVWLFATALLALTTLRRVRNPDTALPA